MSKSIFGQTNSKNKIVILSVTILCITVVSALFIPNSKPALSVVLPSVSAPAPTVSTDTFADLSALTPDQIAELAQLNDKKITRIKQSKSVISSGPVASSTPSASSSSTSSAPIASDTSAVSAASATQDGINLDNALAKYKIPASVQAKLDEINSKDIKWKANYNSIFVKSDEYKKNISSGLKPNTKITNLLQKQPQIKVPTKIQAKVQSSKSSKLLAGILEYLRMLNPAKLFAGLLGSSPLSAAPAVDNFGDTVLPDSFDWRNVGGKNYITSVKDQNPCGTCWAFGAIATLEGNINAYYNDTTINSDLSEQDLVSCYLPTAGCLGGGTADQIGQIFSNYSVNTGVVKETCFPYTESTSNDTKCVSKCSTWNTQVWKTNSSYKVVVDPNATTSDPIANINAIKNAIVNYGPVEVGFIVYYDFDSYSSGIYSHTTDDRRGYHAVSIVGYGVEDGLPYWIVKNSWGSSWGDNGYFKIAMGDSMIDQWFAFAPGTPSYPTAYTKKCTDTDKDGYCYWGTGSKPSTGCPLTCASVTTEDCDDSISSIHQGCGVAVQKTGMLNITSTPSGADVYVQDVVSGNWVLRGQTPLLFKANIGVRNVKITKDDYIEKIFSANVIEGNELPFNITLLAGPKITNPLSFDILRAGDVVDIIGNSGSIDSSTKYEIQWYNIEDYLNSSKGITLLNSGFSVINNGKLAEWDTSSIVAPGFYSFYLKSIIGGKSYFFNSGIIYIDPSLAKGWPQRIAYSVDPGGEFGTNVKNTILSKNTPGPYFADLNFSSTAGSGIIYSKDTLEPVVSDINGDGKKEIVIYKGGIPPEVSVFNSDGLLLWSAKVPSDYVTVGISGKNLRIPLVGDINNDGKDEIVVFNPNFDGSGFIDHSILYALNSNGSILWKTYIYKDYHASILMADLDNDGNKEIIVKGDYAGGSPAMTIVNGNGNITSQWDLPTQNWAGDSGSSPAVGHFDNSNNLQIVYISPSPNNDGSDSKINETVMYLFNKDGSVLPGWPIYLSAGLISSSPVVGDINKDGKDEIVVGFTYFASVYPNYNLGGVYVIGRDGKLLSGWPARRGFSYLSAPAIGDVNGDGYLEIFASQMDDKMYLLKYNGTVMSGWPKDTVDIDLKGSIMGDVNADGKLDVLTTAGNGFWNPLGNGGVYGWNINGSTIAGFPKVTELNATASATLSDLDNDGKTEVIASSNIDIDQGGASKNRGSIYVWKTDKIYNQVNMPWPMFMHDPQHTGCYDCNRMIGICGSANGVSVTTKPVANLCSFGAATTVAGTGPWTWTCTGLNGGVDASCSALKMVNGTCGSVNGTAVTVKPTTNLCSAGTATVVAGTGPWTWSCTGINSGATAFCSALNLINGACGTAATSYVTTATAYAGTICKSGTAIPTVPYFPGQGGSSTWTCNGINGGTNINCTASRAFPACNTVTISGKTYKLSPCNLTATMVDGQGDKTFTTTIVATGSYGFSVYGYGNGFPTYGILGDSSGGAYGNQTLNFHFSDSILNSDGISPKTYNGYLPIHIYQGSETGTDNNYLNFNINLTVTMRQ